MREYLPYFECRAADVFMIDVPWNGFAPSKKIGDLANVFQLNVAPHNYYSHLATHMSASLCAVLPNVRIMEIDIDDVPWKDDLTTHVPDITDGYMKTPTRPGWELTSMKRSPKHIPGETGEGIGRSAKERGRPTKDKTTLLMDRRN